MPYVLSPPIHTRLPGLWGEGAPYESGVIYDIESTRAGDPPVQYNSHLLKPHSIPHIDAEQHIIPGGKTIDAYFEASHLASFYGATTVVKLEGDRWEREGDVYLWRVGLEELQTSVSRVNGSLMPEKLFIAPAQVPVTQDGFHDARYVFVLSVEAAEWLVSAGHFNGFGTSWKSSDYEPGSRERPVHKVLLRQAVLFEQLKLDSVPEGEYWLSAFPIYLAGASESPVTPVLFTKDEL